MPGCEAHGICALGLVVFLFAVVAGNCSASDMQETKYTHYRHARLELRACQFWMRVFAAVFLLYGLVFTSVIVVRLLAGGRPAASHLFCFAKKGMPKKAPQSLN
jgi:hypothetical protein